MENSFCLKIHMHAGLIYMFTKLWNATCGVPLEEWRGGPGQDYFHSYNA